MAGIFSLTFPIAARPIAKTLESLSPTPERLMAQWSSVLIASAAPHSPSALVPDTHTDIAPAHPKSKIPECQSARIPAPLSPGLVVGWCLPPQCIHHAVIVLYAGCPKFCGDSHSLTPLRFVLDPKSLVPILLSDRVNCLTQDR